MCVCVVDQGRSYGLQLNWHKVEQMIIACQADSVLQPDGTPIVCKKSLKYLGIQLASDGHIESEVSIKLGRAAQDFKTLMRLWNHCNISVAFKFIVFSACVIQRLLYGLDSAWLNKKVLAKLGEFYCT